MTIKQRLQWLSLWFTVGIFLSFPVAMGLANTLMLLVVVCWLLGGNYQAIGQRVIASPVALSLLALYALVVLGCLWGDVPTSDRLLHVAKYSKLIFAAILIGTLHERIWQQRCLKAFCWAMLFIMVCTWLNVWIRLPWSVTQTPGWGLSHHVIGDYITQNIMMAFFVLILLTQLWRKLQQPSGQKRNIQMAVLGLTVVLASVSITHLSIGRTGYVLLALAWVICALLFLSGKRLLWAGCAMLLIAGVTLASSQPMRDRVALGYSEVMNAKSDRQSSLGARSYIYATAPKMIAASPWIGHGTGSYHTAVCRYVEPASFCPRINWHPENQYLAFAFSLGLLGLAMYLGLLASMLITAKKSDHAMAKALLFGVAIFLTFNSLVNTSLFSSRESHFFMMMAALATAMMSQRANRPRA
jgi:O-antigen ligase